MLLNRKIIMRCKHGDLAVIIHDFDGCKGNLGILVEVIGPPTSHPDTEHTVWLIKPLKRRKLWLLDEDGPVHEFISKKNEAMHPDPWLLPIRGDSVAGEGNSATQSSLATRKPICL